MGRGAARARAALFAIGAAIALARCPVALPESSLIAFTCLTSDDCDPGARCDPARRLCVAVDAATHGVADAHADAHADVRSDGPARDTGHRDASADRTDLATAGDRRPGDTAAIDHSDAARSDHIDAALPDRADAALPDRADAALPDRTDAAQPDTTDAAQPDSALYCEAPLPDTCDNSCVDLQTDVGHCGRCDNPCNAGISCRGGQCLDGCTDGTVEQIFADNMLGCAGTATWPNRDSQCEEGWVTCSAQQWVDRRAGIAPGHHYWTADNLQYAGTSGACYVLYSGGNSCSASTTPMRVCQKIGLDPELNNCNWANCGFGSATPNEYFGGCNGNTTAGSLCCR